MSEASITLTQTAFAQLPPAAKAAILGLFSNDKASPEAGSLFAAEPKDDEEGLTVLSEAEAGTFLNNCNDKTRRILGLIVERDGRFMMSDIVKQTGNSPSELRGAWAGLTKRVRTVSRTPDATLIAWFRQGSDWRGVVASKTTASMRVALEQRA